MGRPLREMSLEELWRLFPVQLSDHDPAWAGWYAEERDRLLRLLGPDVVRIDHVGSTAVDGLVAKPIVDILLQVGSEAVRDRIVRVLVGDGWTVMAEDPSADTVDLNKGYTPEGFADRVFHLHVRRPGDWDEPHFRDHLRRHPGAADEYAELKRRLKKEFEHDRDGYTAAKTDFVRACTARARAEQGLS